jgi:hypothetical protein
MTVVLPASPRPDCSANSSTELRVQRTVCELNRIGIGPTPVSFHFLRVWMLILL